MEDANLYLEKTLYELINHFENEIVEFKEAKTTYSFEDIGRYFQLLVTRQI